MLHDREAKEVAIVDRNGETKEIHRPQEVPDSGQIEEFRQPIVRVSLILPGEYIGVVMKLCQDRRGVQRSIEHLSPTRSMLVYDMPLAEVIYDLHDKLKSATRGYGTMDYEVTGYEPADLVRMDILVNSKRVDALSVICDRRDSDRRGRGVVRRRQGPGGRTRPQRCGARAWPRHSDGWQTCVHESEPHAHPG